MKPELTPLITREIADFQKSSLDELESRVHEVFEQIFRGDFSAFKHDNIGGAAAAAPVATPPSGGYGAALMQASGGGGYGYGNQQPVDNGGYTFNPQARDLMSSARELDDKVTGPTDRGVISDALSAVKNFTNDASDSVSSLLNPKEKAMELIPKLRAQISDLLTDKHRDLADKFTDEALGQVKGYLHGNISSRDLGEAGVDDAVDAISNFFSGGHKQRDLTEGDRAIPALAGIKTLFSQKIAQGLAVIRGQAQQTLHRDLTEIETNMFADLPSHIRGPLEMVFGGNPFAEAGQPGDRGLVSDVGDKLKSIVRGLQEGLQERARGVVVVGHRALETKAVDSVQEVLVGRVKRYIPDLQI